ncbi:serine/threonine-protein kinase [Bosea sp. PAMC 26642]|uniref:serine/threonine-protein kinase n=1 Tax=Bosea sp. (strain PAMC 26642) TaxID=1792307 RepID=UPI000B2EA67C|nr:serine/threonine-protein kinase [Bosea sp. PAMC 26642]
MNQPAELRKEHWLAVRALFDRLVDLAPAEREAVLAAADAASDVIAEALTLVDASDAAGTFFERPPTRAPVERATASSSDQSLPVGMWLGAFRIEALIGRGGQGEVYRATRADGHSKQVVALRLLRPEAARHFEHFRTEGQIVAGLGHPAIARLVDAGTAPDGRPYLAMEFVDGVAITEFCATLKLDLMARLALFQTVCDAVSYAHRNLIVHRDLKPANVLVTAEGQVKLLDFGVADILTEVGDDTLTQAILTADYAAPEQFEGRHPTTATDVHALGALLFELLVGRPPWQLRNTPFAGALRLIQDNCPQASLAMAQLAETPVPRDRVVGDLDVIIQKAMRYEPEERYGSVAAFSEDLDRYLAFRPVAARAGDTGYRLRRFLRRNRGLLIAATLLVAAMTAGGAGLLWQRQKTVASRQSAMVESQRASAVHDYVTLLVRAAGNTGGPAFATAKRVLDATAAQAQREAGSGTGTILRSLAELYAELDDFTAATTLLQRDITLAQAAGDARALATSRQSLAATSLRLGQIEDAVRELAQAKAYWNTDRALHTGELARAAVIEAGLLRQRGQRDGAIALLRGAITDHTEGVGEKHCEVATLQHNLGVHYLENGALDDAERSFADATRLLDAYGGCRSATGVALLGDRSNLALLRGKTAEAEALIRQAVGQRRALYGPSAALAALQLSLGRMLLASLRVDEGLGVLEEALSFSAALSGEASPTTIVLRQSRAIGLMAKGRDADAAPEIERAISSSGAGFGTGHIYYGLSLAARAQWRLRAGDAVGARRDLDALDDILAKAGPVGTVHTPEARQLRAILDQATKSGP